MDWMHGMQNVPQKSSTTTLFFSSGALPSSHVPMSGSIELPSAMVGTLSSFALCSAGTGPFFELRVEYQYTPPTTSMATTHIATSLFSVMVSHAPCHASHQ